MSDLMQHADTLRKVTLTMQMFTLEHYVRLARAKDFDAMEEALQATFAAISPRRAREMMEEIKPQQIAFLAQEAMHKGEPEDMRKALSKIYTDNYTAAAAATALHGRQ